MARIVIADPSLQNVNGHHLSTTCLLAKSAAEAGLIVLAAVNRRISGSTSGVAHYPVFTDTIYTASLPNSRASIDTSASEAYIPRPAAEFLDFAGRVSLTGSDLVYFHTVTINYVVAMLRCYDLVAPNRFPAFVFMFRYDPETDPWIGSLRCLANALSRLEARGVVPKIALFAETDALADYYSIGLGRIVATLHHFPTVKPPPSPGVRKAGRLVVGYFGEARSEKGFEALSGAFAEAAEKSSVPFEAMAQIYTVGNADPKIRAAAIDMREILRRIGGRVHTEVPDDVYCDMIAAVDVIVLPHRTPSYRRRGSGTFVDALVSGAVVVVRAGTWMSAFANLPNVVVFEDGKDLGNAIITAVERADRIGRTAIDPTLARQFSISTQISTLLDVARRLAANPETSNARPRAVVVSRYRPGTGAAQVVRNQLAMLFATGFDVSFVAFADKDPSETPEEAYLACLAELDFPTVTFHWLCYTESSVARRADGIAAALFEGEKSWLAETIRATGARLPLSLDQWRGGGPLELVLCNQVSLLPIADRLCGDETRVIAEVHEINSIRHALNQSRPVRKDDYRAELACSQLADGLVFISTTDATAYERAGVDVPSITLLPASDMNVDFTWSDDFTEADIGLDRTALVQTTKRLLRRLIGTATNPSGAVRAALTIRHAIRDHKLLVIIGSEESSDRTNLGVFISAVFGPKLAAEGYRLIVVGSISKWVSDRFGNIPGIVPVGQLPDLRAIFESRAIVVLLTAGTTGFPIFVLDAVMSGVSVIATPDSLSGSDVLAGAVKLVGMDGMADAIRAETIAPRRRTPPHLFNFHTYCSTWAAFLSDRLGRPVTPSREMVSNGREVGVLKEVARLIADDEPALVPFDPRAFAMRPETHLTFRAASFGFEFRDGESGWAWSSSWYFGFLLDGSTRRRTLKIALNGVKLPSWADGINLQIFVDGVPFLVRVDERTCNLAVPLFDVGCEHSEPLLLEFLYPEAVWKGKYQGWVDDRALGLSIIGFDIGDTLAPAVFDLARLRLLSDADFVVYAYRRILSKDADEGGLGHYLNLLSHETTRREVLEILLADAARNLAEPVAFV